MWTVYKKTESLERNRLADRGDKGKGRELAERGVIPASIGDQLA
jgi:hypothetical protein